MIRRYLHTTFVSALNVIEKLLAGMMEQFSYHGGHI